MCMHTVKYVIKSCMTCESQEKLVFISCVSKYAGMNWWNEGSFHPTVHFLIKFILHVKISSRQQLCKRAKLSHFLKHLLFNSWPYIGYCTVSDTKICSISVCVCANIFVASEFAYCYIAYLFLSGAQQIVFCELNWKDLCVVVIQ